MAINLKDLQAGVNPTTCNQNNIPTQVVVTKPYCATDCGTTSPPDPSRAGTALTVKNFFQQKCGRLQIDYDNDFTGAVDRIIELGGIYTNSNQLDFVANGPYGADAFFANALTATIAGGPTVSLDYAATVPNGRAAGQAFANERFGNGGSVLLERVTLLRVDTSVAANMEMANEEISPFYLDENFDQIITDGSFSCDVSSNNSGFGSFEWNFACGTVPLTDQTGIRYTIPAGFDGSLVFCFSAVEGNKEYINC